MAEPTIIITLEELSKDESFFADLRNENFVLVLGAGFSFGIKNELIEQDITDFPNADYTDIKAIPVVSQLDGAITISQYYIYKISEGKTFSKSKFYSAKQDDDCQWYGVLEPVQYLRSNSAKKAKLTNCRLVLSKRSVFFHKRRHFSNQANDRSTTQR
jgi:hypothetical protein